MRANPTAAEGAVEQSSECPLFVDDADAIVTEIERSFQAKLMAARHLPRSQRADAVRAALVWRMLEFNALKDRRLWKRSGYRHMRQQLQA